MKKTTDDYSDLIGALPDKMPQHGGRRAGSGKKPKAIQDATEDSHVKYSKARADKEESLAKMAEHNFAVESGKYVPREEVQRASAVAFAAVSQTLRSIPDNLERRLGISPEISEQIAYQIDDIMGDLADDLEAMHKNSGSNTPVVENNDDLL